MDKILNSKNVLFYENKSTILKKQIEGLTFKNTDTILFDIKEALLNKISDYNFEVLKLKIDLVHFIEIYNVGSPCQNGNHISGNNIFIRLTLICNDKCFNVNIEHYFQNFFNIKILEFEIDNELKTLQNTSHLKNIVSSDIVLDNQLAGQMIHECIGHTSEADNYLSHNLNTDKQIGYKWSNIPFNVFDNPCLLDHKGSYQIDAEGNRAFKTCIVYSGIWNELLHTQKTAELLNNKRSCNARRVLKSNKIQPRMSNTYMEPGEYQLNEIIKNIHEGIYLCGGKGGKSFKNCFSLTPSYGQIIKNGKLTNKYIKNIEIVGDKFNTISKINKISGELLIYDHVYGCDKNDENQLHVSFGSPHISITNMILRPQSL